MELTCIHSRLMSIELDGTGFGSFFCSGSEDVFGRLLPNCVGVESASGIDGCGYLVA